MISRLLVANRGEIARRIFRTCRDLGISTAAVYSDVDAAAPHARAADVAVRLPGSAAGDTYLRGDLIIEAALAVAADAVHPGYGFLAENARFAQAVIDAGLLWVGPDPSAIEAMGSKIEAKKMMSAAGVPVLAGLDPDAVTEADLPVLIKASAGGGGRGMRVVRLLADLADQAEAARAEAASAFGDPAVFCEPYLDSGRHIEVQVLADRHGTVWTLGERECSVQRRHQKIIEETPSPLVDAPMRDRLQAAAVRAVNTIGYIGAGTVEFLALPDGSFWFLEMNTRLQVEHPVTESVTGLDLVAHQLSIAEGEALPPSPPPAAGHAVEARIYAEDPAALWRPQSGTLHSFAVPGVTGEFGAGERGLRLDSGVTGGCVIGTHYDPMLAKLIAWAPTRTRAVRALAAALANTRLHGVVTNRDMLVRVLRHPEFLAGAIDTAFLDRHGLADLARPLADADAQELSAVAAALAAAVTRRSTAAILPGLPSGWRNLPSGSQHRGYQTSAGRIDVAYRRTADGWRIDGRPDLTVGEVWTDRVELCKGPVRYAFQIAVHDGVTYVDSALGSVCLAEVERFGDRVPAEISGSLTAPMPATVVRIAVSAGERVIAGQAVMWLEAMKMQHELAAPASGVITTLHAEVGQQVEVGAVLAVLTPDPPDREQ